MTSSLKYQKQLKYVHEVAANYWHQDINKIGELIASIKVLNRTGSKIVCMLPKNGQFPQCVCKVYFSGEGYQNEHTGYESAQSFEALENITIPTIIKQFPEKKAIITENVSLQDSRLDLLRLSPKNQRINWRDVGQWLRRFHDSQISNTPNDLFLEKKFERIQLHLEKWGHLFSHDKLKIISQIVLSARSYIDHHLLEWVISHGDFGLGNIKTSKDMTYIIDFENVTMTPRGYEVLTFLTGMQSTIYFINRQKRYQLFSNNFLQGYDLRVDPNPLNEFFYLFTKMEMIANYNKRTSVGGLRLDKAAYSYLGKRLNKSLCHWLEKRKHEINAFSSVRI